MCSLEARVVLAEIKLDHRDLGCSKEYMYHLIEQLVAQAPVPYISGAIRKWNKKGNLDWLGLEGMISSTYIKDIRKLGINFDDEFWSAYDTMQPWLGEFRVWDLKLIEQMSSDLSALVNVPADPDLRGWFHNWKHYQMMRNYNELQWNS